MDKPKQEGSGKAKASQKSSAKKGAVYQAGGDIHIHSTELQDNSESKSNPLVKWKSVVGIIVAILTALTILLELSGKLRPTLSDEEPQAKDSLFVTGIVRLINSELGIPNAWVTADLLTGDTLFTTSDGTFEFFVKGKPGESIRIYAGAEGYISRNEYHVLPKAISIYLEKR